MGSNFAWTTVAEVQSTANAAIPTGKRNRFLSTFTEMVLGISWYQSL